MAKAANSADRKEDANDDKPKSCFVIMPISNVDGYPPGHFDEVYKQLIFPSVESAGYVCSLATTTNAAHMIQLEVVTRVATADLCVVDLSTNNPNVLFEYGIRQAFDKPTVLVKDDITRRIFDLSGFRDIEYDHTLRISNILKSRELIKKSIEDTVSATQDSGQVFSLVKLMNLTKAALPNENFSPADARFELLEMKLDRIARAVTRSQTTRPSRPPPPYPHLRFRDYDVVFYSDRIVVEGFDGAKETFIAYDDVYGSDWYKRLPAHLQEQCTEMMTGISKDMIPF